MVRDERLVERRSRVRSTLLAAALAVLNVVFASPADADPLMNIGVPEGYALEVHATGLFLPTAIEFLPNAGEAPDVPYYLVAELQGRISTVTRDGSTSTFATVSTSGEQGEDLSGASQQGLAGLCVTPDSQYLFATYTKPDEGSIIRNHIVRFTVTEQDGTLIGTDPTEMLTELARFQSAPAHQVGDCVIVEDRLYVGVGDGGSPRSAARPDVLLGKILCMDWDGRPCPDPPFREDGVSAYVYAKGFRNPFALAATPDGLVAAENGVDLDRFVRIEEGLDHLWDGRDASLAAHAELVFPQPFSPVQLAFVPAGTGFMEPDWSGHFVAAGFGSRDVPGGVAYFGGVPREGMASAAPRYLVQDLGGPNSQHFAGVAVGDDGIYVTPMLPLGEEGSVVLRVHYDPATAHAAAAKATPGLERGKDLGVLAEFGCTGCHEIAGQGGGIGPVLDQFSFHYRITERLNSRPYEERLRAMMEEDGSSSRLNRARQEVLDASGRERMSVWLVHMIQDPKFDDPDREMPDLGLTAAQATAAREELFRALSVQVQGGSRLQRVWEILKFNWAELLVGGIGGVIATLSVLGLVVLRRRSKHKQARSA